MKKILYSLLVAATSLGFSSCMNGDYDANPAVDNSGTTNPLNTGGSGGGGSNSSFNWTGTDPFSAKIDGNSFLASTAIAVSQVGYLNISGFGPNNAAFTIGVPDNPTLGTVYNCSANNCTFTYNDGTNVGLSGLFSAGPAFGGNGAIKITENDATHVKGYFYGTVKNQAGGSHVITEGYFNVTK